MNNTDFRQLLDQTNKKPTDGGPSSTKLGAVSASLGSRERAAIPMTPRTVKGGVNHDFARQLAERNGQGERQKRFKSSNPKGAKIAHGYQDRALARSAAEKEASASADDREARIKALEEQVKLGQIERETFEKLRDQITGGDISATHLVKGLDRQLLARVRRGEDVLNGTTSATAEENSSKSVDNHNEDEELEKIEQQEIAPVVREEVVKKGEMAPPPPVAGTKRSRNDILAELKASRRAAAEAKLLAQTQAGNKFRKLGDSNASSRIELDEKGREVLITVDEDGRVKRKVRKTKEDKPTSRGKSKRMEVLGADAVIPELPSVPLPEDEEDDDIFAGAGTSYDPLGVAEDGDSSSDEERETRSKVTKESRSTSPEGKSEGELSRSEGQSKQEQPANQPKKNNYFNTVEPEGTTSDTSTPFSDPTILATIKRAAKLREKEEQEEAKNEEQASTAAQRLLGQRDRDLDDIDMGFGSSRLEDEEGGEDESRVKLSQWRGLEGDDDDGDGDNKGKGSQTQRKRGKKKRKGDKNSAGDILKVIEGRKN